MKRLNLSLYDITSHLLRFFAKNVACFFWKTIVRYETSNPSVQLRTGVSRSLPQHTMLRGTFHISRFTFASAASPLWILLITFFMTLLPAESSAQKVLVVNNLKVERVIDGSTIELTTGAKVGYIGVDIPREKYFQATEANRQLVEGKTIRLEFDVEKQDRYGRVLAYVYVDSMFVNARLIEEGYARFSSHPKNARHQNIFLDLEEKAKKAEVGIWAKVPSKRKNDLKGKVEIDIENTFVYLTRNGEKYHRASCREMSGSRTPMILRKAKLNYKPCPVCKPLEPESVK